MVWNYELESWAAGLDWMAEFFMTLTLTYIASIDPELWLQVVIYLFKFVIPTEEQLEITAFSSMWFVPSVLRLYSTLFSEELVRGSR